MSSAGSVRVFFEPKIAAHPPELYRFDQIEHGIDAAAAESELGRYREDGFLMARGLLPQAQLDAARVELEQMARSDHPACAMIWYEGALRDHLKLDASADRPLDGTTTASGFVQGQEGALPNVDPALRARLRAQVHELRRPSAGIDRSRSCIRACWRSPGDCSAGSPSCSRTWRWSSPPQGREKPWHQDHAYFNVAMGTPIVGVWIPMGRVTPENGCMHLLRGGHKAGARPHFKRRDWQICDTDVDEIDRVAVPMAGGRRAVLRRPDPARHPGQPAPTSSAGRSSSTTPGRRRLGRRRRAAGPFRQRGP